MAKNIKFVSESDRVYNCTKMLGVVLHSFDLSQFEKMMALSKAMTCIIDSTSVTYDLVEKDDDEIDDVIDSIKEMLLEYVKDGDIDGLFD